MLQGAGPDHRPGVGCAGCMWSLAPGLSLKCSADPFQSSQRLGSIISPAAVSELCGRDPGSRPKLYDAAGPPQPRSYRRCWSHLCCACRAMEASRSLQPWARSGSAVLRFSNSGTSRKRRGKMSAAPNLHLCLKPIRSFAADLAGTLHTLVGEPGVKHLLPSIATPESATTCRPQQNFH